MFAFNGGDVMIGSNMSGTILCTSFSQKRLIELGVVSEELISLVRRGFLFVRCL